MPKTTLAENADILLAPDVEALPRKAVEARVKETGARGTSSALQKCCRS